MYCLGTKLGKTWPKNADRTDMMAKEEKAAANTTNRECFMAIIAAIKKVLSPISDTMIMSKEIRKDFSNSALEPTSLSRPTPTSLFGVVGRLVSASY